MLQETVAGVARNMCRRLGQPVPGFGDPFGRLMEANLPQPLMQLPEGPAVPPVTPVPRPWLPREMPSIRAQDTSAK